MKMVDKITAFFRQLGLLGSIVWMLAVLIPKLAWGVFSVLGWAFTAIGTGFIFLAAWFSKASDEPGEQMVWGGILLALVVVMMIYFGVPLVTYWPIVLFVAVMFALAVLWVLWRRR